MGYYLPPRSCPLCEKHLDGPASSTGTEGPDPGDLTVCAHCGIALVFEEGLALRQLTRKEEVKLDNETRRQLMRVRNVINRARNMS
jgi:hypothetical protein